LIILAQPEIRRQFLIGSGSFLAGNPVDLRRELVAFSIPLMPLEAAGKFVGRILEVQDAPPARNWRDGRGVQ
jgi:hypothetical protein